MERFINLWARVTRIGCIIIGPFFLVLALWWSVKTAVFIHGAKKADGTITQLVPHTDSDSSVAYAPVFRFHSDDNASHELESSIRSNPAGFSIGEQVRVFYSPNNPNDARIGTFPQLWFLPVTVGGCGLIALAVGLLLQLWHRRKMKAALANAAHDNEPLTLPLGK